jgi:hypothetical protein
MDMHTIIVIILVAVWIAIIAVVATRFAQRDRARRPTREGAAAQRDP